MNTVWMKEFIFLKLFKFDLKIFDGADYELMGLMLILSNLKLKLMSRNQFNFKFCMKLLCHVF